MRRFLFLAVLAASLLPFTGPAQAQATADQLNRLSLEALTARPAGGGGGYVRRSDRPRYHASYRRPYRGRSYARASYGYTRRSHYVPPHRSPARYTRGGRSVHPAHAAYHGRPGAYRSARAAVYHRPHHR